MLDIALLASIKNQVETSLLINLDKQKLQAIQEGPLDIAIYKTCQMAVVQTVPWIATPDNGLNQEILGMTTSLLASEIGALLGIASGPEHWINNMDPQTQVNITQKELQHSTQVWREVFWQEKDLAGMASYLKAYLQHGDLIFHILSKAEWLQIESRKSYKPQSLELEGFIHCSTLEQVIRTANKFYLNASELVLLWIAINKVESEVRYEDLLGEGIAFPHIYGPLSLDAVVGVSKLKRGDAGRYVVPGSFTGSDVG